MSLSPLREAVAEIQRESRLKELAGWSDARLLNAFVGAPSQPRDAAAFETLVRRHGPMVLSVCRRVTRHSADAEDAFQATFLVFLRKADNVRPREYIAAWLYGVAFRTALKSRSQSARRHTREQPMPHPPEVASTAGDPALQSPWKELVGVLDAELSKLPEIYRSPVILCELEGKTRSEAARILGWPEGTVAGRLARAKEILLRKMSRHGPVLSIATLSLVLNQSQATAAVPAGLLNSTIALCNSSAVAGGAASSIVVSSTVSQLAQGVLRAMFLDQLKWPTVSVVLLGVVGAGAILAANTAAQPVLSEAAGNKNAGVAAKAESVAESTAPAQNPADAAAANAPVGFAALPLDEAKHPDAVADEGVADDAVRQDRRAADDELAMLDEKPAPPAPEKKPAAGNRAGDPLPPVSPEEQARVDEMVAKTLNYYGGEEKLRAIEAFNVVWKQTGEKETIDETGENVTRVKETYTFSQTVLLGPGTRPKPRPGEPELATAWWEDHKPGRWERIDRTNDATGEHKTWARVQTIDDGYPNTLLVSGGGRPGPEMSGYDEFERLGVGRKPLFSPNFALDLISPDSVVRIDPDAKPRPGIVPLRLQWNMRRYSEVWYLDASTGRVIEISELADEVSTEQEYEASWQRFSENELVLESGVRMPRTSIMYQRETGTTSAEIESVTLLKAADMDVNSLLQDVDLKNKWTEYYRCDVAPLVAPKRWLPMGPSESEQLRSLATKIVDAYGGEDRLRSIVAYQQTIDRRTQSQAVHSEIILWAGGYRFSHRDEYPKTGEMEEKIHVRDDKGYRVWPPEENRNPATDRSAEAAQYFEGKGPRVLLAILDKPELHRYGGEQTVLGKTCDIVIRLEKLGGLRNHVYGAEGGSLALCQRYQCAVLFFDKDSHRLVARQDEAPEVVTHRLSPETNTLEDVFEIIARINPSMEFGDQYSIEEPTTTVSSDDIYQVMNRLHDAIDPAWKVIPESPVAPVPPKGPLPRRRPREAGK